MSSEDLLVFDVGGTLLRAGRWSRERAELTDLHSRPAPSFLRDSEATGESLVEALLAELAEAGREVFSNEVPAAVGLAVPGPVDPQGRLSRAPTLWGDRIEESVPLGSLAARTWPNSRVVVANDVTAAGYRHARSDEALCVVTVSSGIGHKVFVDGRPVVGPNGRGGELGHWRVDPAPDAPRCDCGRRGHLGALASGRAVAHHVRSVAKGGEHGPSPWTELESAPEALNRALAASFAGGDPFAREVVRELAAPLGVALAGVHTIVGVERFVILGGFARALGEPYLELLRDASRAACWDNGFDWSGGLELGPADDNSGLEGMARLLLAEQPETAR